MALRDNHRPDRSPQTPGSKVPDVEVEPVGGGPAGPDRRQRHVARSAVRAMALRTGRSEEEIVSVLGAACVATAFLAALRAVDIVLEAKPVLNSRVRRARTGATSRVRSAVSQAF